MHLESGAMDKLNKMPIYTLTSYASCNATCNNQLQDTQYRLHRSRWLYQSSSSSSLSFRGVLVRASDLYWQCTFHWGFESCVSVRIFEMRISDSLGRGRAVRGDELRSSLIYHPHHSHRHSPSSPEQHVDLRRCG